MKLSGEVVDEAGNLISDYSGVLTATVFDKDINRKTLGNDGIRENGQLIILDFKTLGETIFKGQASVNNGLFDINFKYTFQEAARHFSSVRGINFSI